MSYSGCILALRALGASRKQRTRLVLICGALALHWSQCQVLGQGVEDAFLSRTSPNIPFRSPEPAQYTLKWGDLKARVYVSTQVELNDNINLANRSKEADLLIGPALKTGFFYPVSDTHVMQFNLGISYRYYLQHSELNTLAIDPTSRLEYQITFFKDFKLLLYDSFSMIVDPTSRGEISGSNDTLLNFRRFSTTPGLLLNWQASEALSLSAGYEYTLDRSVSDEFTFLDRDEHNFLATGSYTLGPMWTAGMSYRRSYSFFIERVQNDGITQSVGPSLSWKPARNLVVNGGVSFTTTSAQQTGTVGDMNNFSGLTYSIMANHTVTKYLNHTLGLSRNVGSGFKSNFTESQALQYGVSSKIGRGLTLNSTFVYEILTSSGAQSDSDRYLFYLGLGMQLTKHWNAGCGYSFSLKNAPTEAMGYIQNRLTFDLSRQF